MMTPPIIIIPTNNMVKNKTIHQILSFSAAAAAASKPFPKPPSKTFLNHFTLHISRAVFERGCTRVFLLGDAQRHHLLDFTKPNDLLTMMQLGYTTATLARACEEEEETVFGIMGQDLQPIVKTIINSTRLWDPTYKSTSSMIIGVNKDAVIDLSLMSSQLTDAGWFVQPLTMTAIHGTKTNNNNNSGKDEPLVIEVYGDRRYTEESYRNFE
jgi:hypothetical protein